MGFAEPSRFKWLDSPPGECHMGPCSIDFNAVCCCLFDHVWRVETRVLYGIHNSKHVSDLLGKVTLFVGF